MQTAYLLNTVNTLQSVLLNVFNKYEPILTVGLPCLIADKVGLLIFARSATC